LAEPAKLLKSESPHGVVLLNRKKRGGKEAPRKHAIPAYARGRRRNGETILKWGGSGLKGGWRYQEETNCVFLESSPGSKSSLFSGEIESLDRPSISRGATVESRYKKIARESQKGGGMEVWDYAPARWFWGQRTAAFYRDFNRQGLEWEGGGLKGRIVSTISH